MKKDHTISHISVMLEVIRKLKRVKKDLGIEGYGIYFIVLQVLREQTDFKYHQGC